MSLKVVPFDRLGMIVPCSIVSLSLRRTVFEIFDLSDIQYSDLETRVRGHSRLSEPTRIDLPPMISY